MSVKISTFFFVITSLISCKKKADYYHLPLFSSNNLVHAVIEIPAGTNKKYEYKIDSNSFEIDKKNGADRIVQFLPYVGNYGYIPSTFSDPAKSGDGDALDVLVLSENIPTGTLMEILPIAVLKLTDAGELDYKIIGIPAENSKRIINTVSFGEFEDRFPEVKRIIELWFLNYNKDDEVLIEGWGDEKEALNEIILNQKQ